MTMRECLQASRLYQSEETLRTAGRIHNSWIGARWRSSSETRPPASALKQLLNTLTPTSEAKALYEASRSKELPKITQAQAKQMMGSV